MELDIETIKKEAQLQLANELFQAAVDKEKERLKKHKPFLTKLFPWKIIFIRRG